MGTVVHLSEYLSSPQKSKYELYPLPFFNAGQCCTWEVSPTGNYMADCELGRQYALEFLKSCDGTAEWASLLQLIADDMIRAGQMNGIVTGFMGVIGRAVLRSVKTLSS
jgi:hypothetical protein